MSDLESVAQRIVKANQAARQNLSNQIDNILAAMRNGDAFISDVDDAAKRLMETGKENTEGVAADGRGEENG